MSSTNDPDDSRDDDRAADRNDAADRVEAGADDEPDRETPDPDREAADPGHEAPGEKKPLPSDPLGEDPLSGDPPGEGGPELTDLGVFDVGDGGVVVYDLGNHRAWIQSSATCDVAAMA